YRGVVPIHFSPTFFKPGAEGDWSYVVVWVKAGARGGERPDPQHLEEDLRAYYTGLCGKSGHPDLHTKSPGLVSGDVHLAPLPLAPRDRAAGAAWSAGGELQTVDC